VIRELNSAAAGIFGYTIEELIGQNVSILMPSPHDREHDRYIRNYLNTGDAKIIGIGREVTGLRKDGTTFPHYLAVSEVECTDKSGQRLFTGIVRDISERKRIEEAAHLRLTEHAHASRLAALGEMASGIAHELNQPLAAIVSFADASKRLLKGGTERIGLVDETLSQIAQQGERAGNIIRRLREFVRKGNVERQLISIIDVIEDVLNMLDHDLRMQQVEVIRHFEKDIPNIRADKLQIEQVLLNLARNAIDAMEACRTRTLTITVEKEEHSIVVQVSDSGPGFNKQQAAQLFDAFYTTKRNGTGLGLSISHSIIAAHGGELTADSDLNGATFRFSLPLK
jgi:two-component system sensor kinase FixL